MEEIIMTIKELRDICDALCAKGYGDEAVVYRDDDTDPDLDVTSAYYDDAAERLVVRGW